MNLKEQHFNKLIKEGKSKKEIIEILNISNATYYRYRSNNLDNNFTIEYIKALTFCATREEIAQKLNISRQTLHSKEKDIFKYLIPFLKLHGLDDLDISMGLRTSINKVKKNVPISYDLINDNLDFYKMVLSVVADNSETITIHNIIKEIQQNLSKLQEIGKYIFMRRFL